MEYLGLRLGKEVLWMFNGMWIEYLMIKCLNSQKPLSADSSRRYAIELVASDIPQNHSYVKRKRHTEVSFPIGYLIET